jgi:hypothetical protein
VGRDDARSTHNIIELRITNETGNPFGKAVSKGNSRKIAIRLKLSPAGSAVGQHQLVARLTFISRTIAGLKSYPDNGDLSGVYSTRLDSDCTQTLEAAKLIVGQ